MNKKIIQIAGSKGKGTTAHLLAVILEQSGQRVGLFTSPAVADEREMIQVNGEMIPKEDYKSLMESYAGSEFERQTLTAFEYFEEQECDVWILECGWEYEDDATCWAPHQDLFLLTHIEMEHTAILGDHLEAIEASQLGVRREGTPMIRIEDVASHVCGRHHPACVGLAIAAAEELGVKITAEIFHAMEQKVIPGRFEIIEFAGHKVILDGAHTPDSVDYVLKEAQKYAADSPLPLRFGIHFLEDKQKDLWEKFPISQSLWIPIEDERASECPLGIYEASLEDFVEAIGTSPQDCMWAVMGSFKLVGAFKSQISKVSR